MKKLNLGAVAKQVSTAVKRQDTHQQQQQLHEQLSQLESSASADNAVKQQATVSNTSLSNDGFL